MQYDDGGRSRARPYGGTSADRVPQMCPPCGHPQPSGRPCAGSRFGKGRGGRPTRLAAPSIGHEEAS